jgi:hypothetical protein
MLCRALLQYVNDDAENVVLMENSSSEVFVAIGEYKSSDYTPDRFDSNSGGGGRLIRVVRFFHTRCLMETVRFYAGHWEKRLKKNY